MIKATITMISAVMFAGFLTSGVHAAPITLDDAQMDGVAAGGMEKVEGFVCPVIRGKGVAKNEKFFPIAGGFYSFHGPDVAVPIHATNANGAGRPGGEHASPGDTDYTAIWGFR